MTDNGIAANTGGPPGDAPTPYDTGTGEVKLLTSLEKILAFDRALKDITKGFPKPIRLGSILRVSEVALARWGVAITHQNAEALAARANEYYIQDELESGPDSAERDALRAFRKEQGGQMLGEIKNYIGSIVKEMLRVRDNGKRKFTICDIAAGSGHLSTSIAATIRGDPETEALLQRVEFHLVDYTQKLAIAERSLRAFGVDIVSHAMQDDKFLQEHITDRKEGFDFVVLSCHSHHKPAISSYLKRIHGATKKGSVLISGDWHSPLPQYPNQVHTLLQTLGVDRAKLGIFEDLLGPLMLEGGYADMENEHRKALQHHLEYWERLAGEIGKPKYGEKLRVRLLSAFLTSDQLAKEFGKAGFETDSEKLRSAFPQAKLPSVMPIRLRDRSDTVAVTVGMRR